MPNFKCAQFGACVLLIVLLTSLQLYVKDQTLETRIRRVRHAPVRIPSPVREYNTTLCPKGRPKPKLDDILCMAPFNYSTLHKNPCWTAVNGNLKCLPYFQVIGMDKCGTTDLFARISRHPDVVPNAKDKETMWWSWERYGYWLWSAKAKITFLPNYISYFANLAQKLNHSTQGKGKTRLITGDGTPMDMWDFRGWKMIPQNRGLQEPKYLTPHLIQHINPGVKLIVLLRNPADRLYSDYYFIDNGERVKNRTTFHLAVVKAINVLKNCQRHMTLRSCLFDFKINEDLVKRKTRVHLGFYAAYLQEWLSVFPRDQILVMRTEDYSANTTLLMRAFRRRGTEEIKYHDTKKGACYKIQTGEGTYDDKDQSNVG
uniref:Carbohydrate sulfotransferase 15-like isoform X2 n=1 Tax=Crassostrea virginica TaxID=6565 RepID=A0A8B8CKX2_CRAVI|nr:carbohydrate sulfotransferase 15-like isoform X2 [Crassostrea virginica]